VQGLIPGEGARPPVPRLELATFGEGCFWCSEAVFSELVGVVRAEPGYAGGSVESPTYEQVCSDDTGHAEVVQVTFDPAQITFREIMEVFFSTHDPTTLNRQGADVGTQYRSVIFFHDAEQKRVAEEVMAELTRGRVFRNPIVTQVVPFEAFYPAEAYHHNYFKNNPNQGYCQAVIAPKLAKFRAHHQAKLKPVRLSAP
jgi:peptide-methionine (S)-S-oxide reductase